MTKQFSIQNELTSVRNDLNVLSADELFSQYGIIINEDGTVFDDLEQKTFENKTKWVQHYGTVLLQELQEEQERERWEDEFSDEEDH